MTDLDLDFFEAYKNLEKLLNQIYSSFTTESVNGVKLYLQEMESKASSGTGLVGGWADDYSMLKHIRWLRNQLSHELVEGICDECDYQYTLLFHQRLMNGTDPLSMYRQAVRKRDASIKDNKKAVQQNAKYIVTQVPQITGTYHQYQFGQPRIENSQQEKPESRKQNSGWIWWILGMILVAVILIAAYRHGF